METFWTLFGGSIFVLNPLSFKFGILLIQQMHEGVAPTHCEIADSSRLLAILTRISFLRVPSPSSVMAVVVRSAQTLAPIQSNT